MNKLHHNLESFSPRVNASGMTNHDALPHAFKDQLPDPKAYYEHHLGDDLLPSATGWALSTCPFCPNEEQHSISVNLIDGRWRCYAVSHDVVRDLAHFHMLTYGLGLREAVSDLMDTWAKRPGFAPAKRFSGYAIPGR